MNSDHSDDGNYSDYVQAALRLQGCRLTPQQQAGVAAAFAGIAAIAFVLMRQELPLELEPAPVFLP